MHSGMYVRSFKGSSGRITVPGLGAVPAVFSSWQLIRREESGSAGPNWSLHAVCSYVNLPLMNNAAVKKRIFCVLSKDQVFELCEWTSLTITGASLIAEGVIQCQK